MRKELSNGVAVPFIINIINTVKQVVVSYSKIVPFYNRAL